MSVHAQELGCGTVFDRLEIGEVHVFTLTAEPGSTIMAAVGEPTGLASFNPSIRITDGDDTTLAECSGTNACIAEAELTGPAPHRLTVYDIGSDASNIYNLSVVPLSNAFPGASNCWTTVQCGTAQPFTRTLERGYLHSYRLTAEPGSLMMFAVGETPVVGGFDPTFLLTDRDGNKLASCTAASGCNEIVTLTGAAPYTVTVYDDPGTEGKGDYTFSVVPLSDAYLGLPGCSQPIGCSAPTPMEGELRRGELDSYVVEAEPGSVLMIGIGEVSGLALFNPSFLLTDGDGVEIASCSGTNGCQETATLVGPEPYTLTAYDAGSDQAHQYTLSVVPLSDAFPGQTGCTEPIGCSSKLPISGSLMRGEIDSYRIQADPGSVVMIALAEQTSAGGFEPNFVLTDGNGTQITSCYATIGCNRTATLTGPAPHTVTVYDFEGNVAWNYFLTIAPLSDGFSGGDGCATPIDCLTLIPINDHLDRGELDTYRIDAVAGDVVEVSITDTPPTGGFDPGFTISNGSGTSLVSCSGTNGCNRQIPLSGPEPFAITVFDVSSDAPNGYSMQYASSACSPTTTTEPTSASSTTTTTVPDGICSVPFTDGPVPKASDCLLILKAAVGAYVCSPDCICDTNGDDQVSASDALTCLGAALGGTIVESCPCP